MKQLLRKILDISRSALDAIVQFVTWLVRFLQSVNIDQPRVVLLCVTLQFVVVLSMVLAFQNPSQVKPLQGQIQSEIGQETLAPENMGPP